MIYGGGHYSALLQNRLRVPQRYFSDERDGFNLAAIQDRISRGTCRVIRLGTEASTYAPAAANVAPGGAVRHAIMALTKCGESVRRIRQKRRTAVEREGLYDS